MSAEVLGVHAIVLLVGALAIIGAFVGLGVAACSFLLFGTVAVATRLLVGIALAVGGVFVLVVLFGIAVGILSLVY